MSTGVQLLPATAGIAASNPLLSAALLDVSKNNALVKAMQAIGGAERARFASLGLEATKLDIATSLQVAKIGIPREWWDSSQRSESVSQR